MGTRGAVAVLLLLLAPTPGALAADCGCEQKTDSFCETLAKNPVIYKLTLLGVTLGTDINGPVCPGFESAHPKHGINATTDNNTSTAAPTSAPTTMASVAPTTSRCYIHEHVLHVYKQPVGASSVVDGNQLANSTLATVFDTSPACTDPGSTLARPALVRGTTYIRGVSGPCAWRPGPLVLYADVPDHLHAWMRETHLPPSALKLRAASEEAGSDMARCEGDCNADGECGAGLKCFQRSAFEAVPGCIVGGEGDKEGIDYCSATCPPLTIGGTGSVAMVWVVIVVIPVGLVVLWAALLFFGPDWLTRWLGKSTAPSDAKDGAQDTGTPTDSARP